MCSVQGIWQLQSQARVVSEISNASLLCYYITKEYLHGWQQHEHTMYIKSLTIQGFKSYRDQVVVNPFR